jgi:hypothetical protein
MRQLELKFNAAVDPTAQHSHLGIGADKISSHSIFGDRDGDLF